MSRLFLVPCVPRVTRRRDRWRPSASLQGDRASGTRQVAAAASCAARPHIHRGKVAQTHLGRVHVPRGLRSPWLLHCACRMRSWPGSRCAGMSWGRARALPRVPTENASTELALQKAAARGCQDSARKASVEGPRGAPWSASHPSTLGTLKLTTHRC